MEAFGLFHIGFATRPTAERKAALLPSQCREVRNFDRVVTCEWVDQEGIGVTEED
jgi:hypothetical protein